jgi:hypothetical protein
MLGAKHVNVKKQFGVQLRLSQFHTTWARWKHHTTWARCVQLRLSQSLTGRVQFVIERISSGGERRQCGRNYLFFLEAEKYHIFS